MNIEDQEKGLELLEAMQKEITKFVEKYCVDEDMTLLVDSMNFALANLVGCHCFAICEDGKDAFELLTQIKISAKSFLKDNLKKGK